MPQLKNEGDPMKQVIGVLISCVLVSITTFGQNMVVKPYSCEWVAAKAATEKLSAYSAARCAAQDVRTIQVGRSYQVDLLCTLKAKYRAIVYVRANAAGCNLESIYGNPFIKPMN